MKALYKYIYIPLLISGAFFFALHFSTPINDKTLEPYINQDTEIPLKSDALCNHDGIYKGDSLNNMEYTNQDEWDLIWQDEFENNCLDSGNWNLEDWAAEKNKELQYYLPDNVKVEEGVLKLISRNEKFKGRDYTSGAVHTKGKFSFLYGKAEMRAKLPAGQGLFPAFWMLPDKKDTWLPEIDIMEMLGHRPNEVWMVSHWLDKSRTLKSDANTFKGPNFSKEFHTFSIEWTPDSITWFIDDIERFRSSKSVPREKMYLYLNTAIGGNWPGSPDDSTVFPVNFEIDYVRVFKRNSEQ